MADTRYLYLLIMSNSFRFQPRFLRRKTDAKVQPFSKLQKYFFKITVGVGLFALIVMLLCYENFFVEGLGRGCKRGSRGRFSRFFGGVSAGKRGFRGILLYIVMDKTVGFVIVEHFKGGRGELSTGR